MKCRRDTSVAEEWESVYLPQKVVLYGESPVFQPHVSEHHGTKKIKSITNTANQYRNSSYIMYTEQSRKVVNAIILCTSYLSLVYYQILRGQVNRNECQSERRIES